MLNPANAASPCEGIAFGAGCFWCYEGIFAALRGVQLAESGYSNGQPPPVTYDDVCRGDTGCAEVVWLRYDPQQIAVEDLLAVFFAIHDPSTLNRQGADVGSQYRSGIYTTTAAQMAAAEAAKTKAAQALGVTVVTEIAPLRHYQAAEAYHQNYFAKHPQQPYCQAVAAPKMRRAMQQFAHLLR